MYQKFSSITLSSCTKKNRMQIISLFRERQAYIISTSFLVDPQMQAPSTPSSFIIVLFLYCSRYPIMFGWTPRGKDEKSFIVNDKVSLTSHKTGIACNELSP